jgi:hypothetical protein
MEKRDFVYQFTNIFLAEAVKETIFIENWDEKKDFDPRYEEYPKFFLAMKKKCLSNKFSEKEIVAELIEKKDEVVKNFNAKFYSIFINEIMERGCTEEIAIQLIPKDIFTFDTINTNAIKTFRKLEESLDKKERRN